MAEDFYNDDYGGDYYDGGGYGGDGMTIEYAPYEPTWGLDLPQFEPEPFAPYIPEWGLELPTLEFFSDPYLPDLPFYQGPSFEEVLGMTDWFNEPPGFEVYNKDYFGQYEVIPELPDISGPFYGLPYVSDYNYWQSTPYTPIFPDLPAPRPPVGPSPATQQPNLPPACPGGYYHPYPIGHPQQNECRPFPPAPTPSPTQQQQRPPQQAPAPAPRPSQQQQQCPTGYYRDSATGQCKPIPRCTTPGTVFDPARGICVPQGRALSPLPSEAGDILSNLKNLPWWVWAAGLGALLLLGKDDDGRKTTVVHRRAS